jgi:hypothetical protein
VIEILRFELVPGADEAAFLEADKRVQAEFAYQQRGLIRRTAARGDDGRWVVIDLWYSAEAAEAANDAWDGDPAAQAYMAFVEPGSVSVERYEDLGG